LREPQLRNNHLVKCKGCELVYLNPRPTGDNAAEFYREEGYDPFLSLHTQQGLLDRAYVLARRQTLRWKKRLVGKLVASGARILDVGCGTGEFLSYLTTNFNVEGIEPEPEAARWARERFGLKVHTGNLDDAPLDTGHYDLITLWHVLEHVPDPSQVLDTIFRLLKPDGSLLIALPNICSLDARIYGSCWVALDTPRHLYHFSKPQAEMLVQKSGFKPVGSGMMPLDTFYNSLYSEIVCRDMKGIHQFLLAPLRLTCAISASLLWGAATGQHSGKFYIFDKA